MTAMNDITGDSIVSKTNNDKYRAGYEVIFNRDKCERCVNVDLHKVVYRDLTLKDFSDRYIYNSNTGVFIYKNTGKTVGTKKSSGRGKDYIVLAIGKKQYYAHKVAWIMSYGNIDSGFVIDHIDGNGLNNKIDNLRVCTQAENSRNQIRKKNVNKLKGTTYDKTKNKWVAQIKKDYKKIYIGAFNTMQEAHNAYALKAKELFKEYANI